VRGWVLTGERREPIRLQEDTGIYVGPVTMLRDCLGAFAASGVRPVIDRTFGFDDVPAAFGYLRSGGHLGKIVIER
jgi:NADPH:quinone reductase-like Zn-dependent oxidoreductase